MNRLKVKRFIQEPACCAVAASTAIANYYNKEITYDLVKVAAEDIVGDEIVDGMSSGEILQLLNAIGFKNLIYVSSDVNFLDFSWNSLSKKYLIENLKSAYKINKDYKENIKTILKALESPEYNDKLIIDYHYGKYIRNAIDNGMPVFMVFNWTIFFRFSKYNNKGLADSIRGDYEEHAVVINGYDDKNISIVDSHNDFYKGRLSKYKTGRYTMTWEEAMSVMNFGEIIIPSKYNKKLVKYVI